MPVYDYYCGVCDLHREVQQSMNAAAPACTACKGLMERRFFGAPAVHGKMARGREQAIKSLSNKHAKGCPCCSS